MRTFCFILLVHLSRAQRRYAKMRSSQHGPASVPALRSYLGAFTSARLIAQEQRNVEAALSTAVLKFTRQATGYPPEMTVDDLSVLIRGLDGSTPTGHEIDVFIEVRATPRSHAAPATQRLLVVWAGRAIARMHEQALDQNAGAIDGKVHLEEFQAAILPWISFSTIDVDRSATLSRDELKVLLWISDGVDTKEPSSGAISKVRTVHTRTRKSARSQTWFAHEARRCGVHGCTESLCSTCCCA